MKRYISKIVLLAALVALCFGVFYGCSAGDAASKLTDAQQANRTYMQKVNTIMASFDNLYTDLQSALESGDADAAKKCVDLASSNLDSLKILEVPEALTDVHAAYVAGSEKLVQAVNDYYALYADKADAASSAYRDSIAQIQSMYNEGVSQLQSGDSAAASKQ